MTMQNLLNRYKKLCVLTTIAALAFFFFLPTYTRVKFHQSIFGFNHKECVIPEVLMDNESAPFFWRSLPTEVCSFVFPPLVGVQDDVIYKLKYSFINTSMLNCSYTPIYRKNPKVLTLNYEESYNIANFSVRFREKINPSEFVKVNCSYDEEEVYEEYFALHPKKSQIATATDDKPSDPFNVLLVGIKSVSRFNVHRTMNQTIKYVLRELNASEYIKYHRIGTNSFDNSAPLLTGLNSDEFSQQCSSFTKSLPRCPFIWDEYSKKGYKTAFAEDCTARSMFKKNFVFQVKSTDYYWAPLNVAAHSNTGNVAKEGCKLCLRSKPSYKILLDYALNFATRMKQLRNPYFGLFWINSLTSTTDASDGLNLVSLADEDFRKFFENLKHNNLLTRTVLIFFSESGYMTDKLKYSRPFRIQANLPFLFVVLPVSFERRHPKLAERLRANENKLVTLFDLHETLKDLVDVNRVVARDNRDEHKSRAYSLFDQIPSVRLCNWAGIQYECCLCTSFSDLFV